MLGQFKISLKSSIMYVPLLLILIVCQLALGQIGSVALGEKKPELSVALSFEGSGEYAESYLQALKDSETLKIIDVGANADKEKVFNKHSVQGLVVISENFEESITKGLPNAVYLYPAPGIGDVSLVEEMLATEIVVMRATVIFDNAMKEFPKAIGGKHDKPIDDNQITVNYTGPPIDARPLSAPPAFGIPALFFLLAFLHASQVVPGIDSKRMLISGRISLLNGIYASQIALLIIWIIVLGVYSAGMKLIYNVALDSLTLIAFLGLIIYAITAGGLVATLGTRTKAVFIFIPILLLNMTIGGGLWNVGVQSPIFAPILPVASVVLASSGSYMFTGVVYAMSILCIVITMLIPRFALKSKHA